MIEQRKREHWWRLALCSLENPLPRRGGAKRQRSRSAGVGFLINNPHQVVGYGPKPPLKSPLVQGGTQFSSNVAPPKRHEKLL
jgi:hypothetical protein